MYKRPLLIATTNQGKFHEIKHFLNDLPFNFLSLNDLSKKIRAPQETGKTLEDNAVLKAKYYAKKSGMLSLADDTGLFIDTLKGWPGVKSARVASHKSKLIDVVLKRMRGKRNRTAAFFCAMTIFDPNTKNSFTSLGTTKGRILQEKVDSENKHLQYSSIFYISESKKTLSEMTTHERNSVSHRGKALSQAKYYLMNQYGSKHIVVPIGLVIQNGKIMATLRNDPHRPEFHRKWEFPGGTMEFGEQLNENVVRELREETGYDVEVLAMLQHIQVTWVKDVGYQVYLLPFVCKIVGGECRYNDAETLDLKFFEINDLAKQTLIGQNKKMYLSLLPELKELIKKYSL